MMIVIREATPEERRLIRRSQPPVFEIPRAHHLTPARVAELVGMPREEFLGGPVPAVPEPPPPHLTFIEKEGP